MCFLPPSHLHYCFNTNHAASPTMVSPENSSTAPPPPSALHTFLKTHPLPAGSPYSDDLHNLALQIAHNLCFQHLWTDVCLHTHSPVDSIPLARPLLSGVPPTLLYVHPDEQIELLQKQKDEGKGGMPHLEPQREWVLPSHLREKWSLRRFGETFESISVIPSVVEAQLLFPPQSADIGGESQSNWRTDSPKRLLLATLDDDSTVVYYIVHDGIVKPRQN